MTGRVVYKLTSCQGRFRGRPICTGFSGIFICRGLGLDNGGDTERPRPEHDK